MNHWRLSVFFVTSFFIVACNQSSPTPAPDTSKPAGKEATVTAAAGTIAPRNDASAVTQKAAAKPMPSAAVPGLPAGMIKKTLQFKKGETSATIEDAAVLGEQHYYEFSATAGQRMDVSITSLESNAVFHLYVVSPYSWQDRLNSSSNVAFIDIEKDPHGKPIGIDSERTSWTGKLPEGSKTGPNSIYAIVVGGTRGNATYTMKVSITSSDSAAQPGKFDDKCSAGYSFSPNDSRCHQLRDCTVGATKTAKCNDCMGVWCMDADASVDPK